MKDDACFVGNPSKKERGNVFSVWGALKPPKPQTVDSLTFTTSSQCVRNLLRIVLSLIESIILAIGRVSVLTFPEEIGFRTPKDSPVVFRMSMPLGTLTHVSNVEET